MAEADPLRRIQAAARRSAGPVPVETQRKWHYDELDRDIGRDTSPRPDFVDVPDNLLARPLAIFIMALLTFAITLAVLLWHDGAFDRFLPAKGAAPISPGKWILSGAKEAVSGAVPEGTTNASDAPPNEIEPLLHPAPVKAAVEPEPSDDALAEDQ
jgi:hypothetical protein